MNSAPVTTTAAAFDEKIKASKGKLNTNVGFWGGIIPGNENEIFALIQKGVLGFEAFLTHSGIDDFPNVTEHNLRKAMPVIAKHKLPLLVHCELTGFQERETGNSEQEARNYSYINYLNTRPKKWKDDVIAMMIRLCEEPVVVHLMPCGSSTSLAMPKSSSYTRGASPRSSHRRRCRA